MSWLLFMDESGHDHKTTPYEVRGGVAVSVGKLWDLVRSIQQAELDAFGCRLVDYRVLIGLSHPAKSDGSFPVESETAPQISAS